MEKNLISKACGYCLKVFQAENKNEIGCLECRKEVDKLIRQGTLLNFIPKNLYEKIEELEERINSLERGSR